MSMTTDSLALLTFDGRSQRAESVRWYLVDSAGTRLGELHYDVLVGGRVENNINRSIKRSLSDVALHPRDVDDINPLVDRLMPVWLLEDGSEWPLGVFMFSAYERAGAAAAGDLVDQGIILDQPLGRSVSFGPGTAIPDAIESIAREAGIARLAVDAGTGRSISGEPVTWAAGRATTMKVVNELCAMGGYTSAYFDNEGVMRVRPALAASDPHVDFDYDSPPRVKAGSEATSDDLLDAPNAWVVIDTSPTPAPIVGSYELPSTADNSRAKRGFAVRRTVEVQGLADQAAADAAAFAASVQDASNYAWASFDAAADPRHDTFQVVMWQGARWREQSWTLELEPGGNHHHELRRIWT